MLPNREAREQHDKIFITGVYITLKPNGKEFIISLRNKGKSKYEMRLRTNGEPSDALSIPSNPAGKRRMGCGFNYHSG